MRRITLDMLLQAAEKANITITHQLVVTIARKEHSEGNYALCVHCGSADPDGDTPMTDDDIVQALANCFEMDKECTPGTLNAWGSL